MLSNIYEYLNFGDNVSIENAKKYVDFIKNVLLSRVKDNGSIMNAYLCKYDDKVDKFIKESLVAEPDGWEPSTDLLSGLDNIEKYLTEYTGQNVSITTCLMKWQKKYHFIKY